MMFAICMAFLSLAPGPGHAALTTQDRETQILERMIADNPQAALKESEAWLAQGNKAADKVLKLKAMRLMVMAVAALEESRNLGKQAELGLVLAREMKDAQAETEFLSAKASALASDGKYLDAQPIFDEAIRVAEQAGLNRAVTGVMVSKAFVYGLLGRDMDSLDMLFKAHQRYMELGDMVAARATLSAIGNAYAHDHASRDDLLKALNYHEQSIEQDSEKNRRHDLSTVYFNIGVVYQRLKDITKAKLYIQKSMALLNALEDPVGEAFGNYRLGMLAGEIGQWSESLSYQDKALPVLTRSGDATMIFNVQRARAKAFAFLDRRRDSLDALARANAIRSGIDSSWIEVTYLSAAAEVYSRLGDYEKAYRHQALLRDSEQRSFKESRDKEATEMQTRFEVTQKEAENALLRAHERESEARRLALVLAVILLLILLGGLSWFLFRQGQQKRRFASLAMRDDLTALPNRRSIIEFTQTQLRAMRSDNQTLCVALVDIDHFKAINDECGHAVGDAVLAAFAFVCAQQLRSVDRLGRYGGEEFMLVMPGSGVEQIPQVFARLRATVQKIAVEGLPADRHITFSMGATTASMADDLDKLTKRADDALYRAKHGGRDRFELG